jgi:hypothetical protein
MLGVLRTFQQRAGAPLLPNCAKAPPMRHASGRSMVAVEQLACSLVGIESDVEEMRLFSLAGQFDGVAAISGNTYGWLSLTG